MLDLARGRNRNPTNVRLHPGSSDILEGVLLGVSVAGRKWNP